MNNEETVVMKPQNNNKAEQEQRQESSRYGSRLNCGRYSRWWCCLCCYGNAP